MARSRIGPGAGRAARRPAMSIPFPPMEAQLVRELPDGDGWQYEPKWDGFRGLLENASGELRSGRATQRPLLRYFPELRAAREDRLPPPLGDRRRDRHRARWRPRLRRDADAPPPGREPRQPALRRDPRTFHRLRRPRLEGHGARGTSSAAKRRAALERSAKRFELSPCDARRESRSSWLDRFEAIGLDGVIAKRLDLPYLPASRDGVVKVKPEKTADCVVVGVRWKSRPDRIATLLLGLYGDDGEIDYVGSAAVAPASTTRSRSRVLPLLDRMRPSDASPSRTAGAAASSRSQPVRPELVVEVRYDKVQATASGTGRS